MPGMRDARKHQVWKALPWLFKPGEAKTVLYVGAKPKKRWPKGMTFMDDFIEAGYEIDVLEPWSDNVIRLKQLNENGREFKDGVFIEPGIFRNVILGDVRKVRRLTKTTGPYDVIFWWHGPEHITCNELESVLKQLERMVTRAVVVGCPYGKYKQIAVGGNPYEVHQTAIYPEFFEHIGWGYSTLGDCDVRTSNLIGWKDKRTQ